MKTNRIIETDTSNLVALKKKDITNNRVCVRACVCVIWLFDVCMHILYSEYIYISLVTTVLLGCVLRDSLYLHYPTGGHRFGTRPPKQPTGVYIVPSPLFSFVKWLHPSQGGDRVGSEPNCVRNQMTSFLPDTHSDRIVKVLHRTLQLFLRHSCDLTNWKFQLFDRARSVRVHSTLEVL
jgi:hypothetical protein